MDLRRLSSGEWIAAAAALLLLVSLFLPWYAGAGLSAWEAMAVNDVVLAAVAVLTLGAVLVVATPRLAGASVAAIALATFPAVVAVVLVGVRLTWPAADGDVGLGAGAWLGLAAALGLAAGSWVGMRDEGPARRSSAAERAAAEKALASTELVRVDGGRAGAPPAVGTPRGGESAG